MKRTIVKLSHQGGAREYASPHVRKGWAVTQSVDQLGEVHKFDRSYRVTHARIGALIPYTSANTLSEAVALCNVLARHYPNQWPRAKFGVPPKITKALGTEIRERLLRARKRLEKARG